MGYISVSSKLFNDIKSKISELDHWIDKQETKSQVDILIRDTLMGYLPDCYDDNSITNYRQHIYEYVCTRYGHGA